MDPKTQAALRIAVCHTAEEKLRCVQRALRVQGCIPAARAVAKARKSVQGALRHAHRLGAEFEDRDAGTLMMAAAIGHQEVNPKPRA